MTRPTVFMALVITMPALAWACTCPWDYPTCKPASSILGGEYNYCEDADGSSPLTGCGCTTLCEECSIPQHRHYPTYSYSPHDYSYSPHSHSPHFHGPSESSSTDNSLVIWIVVIFSVAAFIMLGYTGRACRHAYELSRLRGAPAETPTTIASSPTYGETPLPLMAKGCCKSLRWKTYKSITVEYPRIASELSSSEYRLCKLLWEYRLCSPRLSIFLGGLLTIVYIGLAIAVALTINDDNTDSSYNYGLHSGGGAGASAVMILLRAIHRQKREAAARERALVCMNAMVKADQVKFLFDENGIVCAQLKSAEEPLGHTGVVTSLSVIECDITLSSKI